MDFAKGTKVEKVLKSVVIRKNKRRERLGESITIYTRNNNKVISRWINIITQY